MKRIFTRHLIVFLPVFTLSLLIIFLLPFFQKQTAQHRETEPEPIKISFIERKLLELIGPTIRNDPAIINQELLNEAMRNIFDSLYQELPPNPYEFEIYVVDSVEVNAFASPGGLIVFHSALLNRCDSAEEVAAVMAHEIGHIIHKDSVKRIRSEMGLNIIFFILFGGSQNIAESLTKTIISNTYSRGQERKADQFCFELMAKAGIDPIHYANFFERLTKEEGYNSLPVFSTHPQAEDRIEAARTASGQFSAEPPLVFDIKWEKVKETLPSVFH